MRWSQPGLRFSKGPRASPSIQDQGQKNYREVHLLLSHGRGVGEGPGEGDQGHSGAVRVLTPNRTSGSR